MTITEFILARVAEKEEGAKAAYPSPWRAGGNPSGHVWTGADGDPEDGPTVYVNGGIYANQRRTAEHIARAADPARVLAECEAMRRMVEWAAPVLENWPNAPKGWRYISDDGMDVLKILALPYSDHLDYRQEWR